ncbi:putative hydrolases of HD superfamily [Pseudomonas cuatrocienegasensis]|uniref:Hydrolases of HD superfamily n=1 Tax=Pseudomonas cuatrocienegasensis TaxID=543360 RepID=A0ABY1B1Y8_9PSED|nr:MULTISPECIES: HD domain-containing protein [Pseudomonas]OEC36416.1 phosphohydrolase [Pseudomonas sp. 21C1]SEP72521.1 putative hydrolases of HD superfamily [Pseudomonas cuatrocienegasensis]
MRELELEGILDFLRGAEQLKNTLRSSNTSNGRHESTAEHTWRLCLMVMLFSNQYPEIDILKLMKICIIHDLGEAISGDIAAVDQIEGVNKGVEERKDLELLLRPLQNDLKEEIITLWDEYENASSKEALLAKAFDKIETILQHTQGINPPDFNYKFNLSYGKKYTDYDEFTSKLRALIDKDTQALAEANNSPQR